MFMTFLRIAKKIFGGSHLVKKSASFNSDLTKGTTMSPSSTFSRTRKCLRAMCLERALVVLRIVPPGHR